MFIIFSIIIAITHIDFDLSSFNTQSRQTHTRSHAAIHGFERYGQAYPVCVRAGSELDNSERNRQQIDKH